MRARVSACVCDWFGLLFVQAIIFHAVFLLSWFAGAINFAVRSAHWQRLEKAYDTTKPDSKVVTQSVPFSVLMSSSAAACVRACSTWY